MLAVRVATFETFRIAPRWLLLRLETEDGLVGWGEPVLEGHVPAVEAEVRSLAADLVSHGPVSPRDAWQRFYRRGCYRGGAVLMSAMSGIDMALWDLTGKALGAPVHQLLGGPVRQSVRTCTWIGGDTPEGLDSAAMEAGRRGFSAVKFNVAGETPYLAGTKALDEAVARVASLRDTVGHDMDLIIDFHGRVHAATAKVLIRELAPFRPLWVEDVVPADTTAAAIEVARSTDVPVAIGERVTARSEFSTILESRAFGVINADPAHCGGITESVRLAGIAEGYDVAFTPHCPLGPVALSACLQIDAVAHNAVLQEQSIGMHYGSGVTALDYVTSGIALEDGYLLIPQGPGLGIEVNEEAVRVAAREPHTWSPPEWRHADGSVAEW